jgi:N-dimethylarginine dimethylaminohydrolase
MIATRPRARFLMCRPEHFAVSYAINPWMDPQSWARDRRAHAAAVREWEALHRKFIELGATVELGVVELGGSTSSPSSAPAAASSADEKLPANGSLLLSSSRRLR